MLFYRVLGIRLLCSVILLLLGAAGLRDNIDELADFVNNAGIIVNQGSENGSELHDFELPEFVLLVSEGGVHEGQQVLMGLVSDGSGDFLAVDIGDDEVLEGDEALQLSFGKGIADEFVLLCLREGGHEAGIVFGFFVNHVGVCGFLLGLVTVASSLDAFVDLHVGGGLWYATSVGVDVRVVDIALFAVLSATVPGHHVEERWDLALVRLGIWCLLGLFCAILLLSLGASFVVVGLLLGKLFLLLLLCFLFWRHFPFILFIIITLD